jgi:hypothetical protein
VSPLPFPFFLSSLVSIISSPLSDGLVYHILSAAYSLSYVSLSLGSCFCSSEYIFVEIVVDLIFLHLFLNHESNGYGRSR